MKPIFVGFTTLKETVSMEQILQRYGLLAQLRRSGDSLTGPCPLHAGHNKTQFRVSLSKNCWICFGDCHAGGSLIDFVSRKERIGIRDAGLLIQHWFDVQPPTHPVGNGHAPPTPEHQRNGHHPSHDRPAHNPPLHFTLKGLDPTHPYLSHRGLSAETIATFGLGYCTAGIFIGWIAIPIHDRGGRLVAYAGRWPGDPPETQPKYRLPRGFRKSLEVFNLHRLAPAPAGTPLVVVEGFFGCMKLWQAGIRHVVSLMGSTLSAPQADSIVAAAGPEGRVMLLFDEDEAGRNGRAQAHERLSRNVSTQIVSLKKEGTQPEDLSPDQLRELVS